MLFHFRWSSFGLSADVIILKQDVILTRRLQCYPAAQVFFINEHY